MDLEMLEEFERIAKSATYGEWWVDSHGMGLTAFTDCEDGFKFLCGFRHERESVRHEDTGNLSAWENDNDPTHIATFNPKNVLKLIELAKIGLAVKEKEESDEIL